MPVDREPRGKVGPGAARIAKVARKLTQNDQQIGGGSRQMALRNGLVILNHSQNVAARLAAFAVELVNQATHEVDATAADPELPRVVMRHGAHVERITVVQQPEFQTVFHWQGLKFEHGVVTSAMGVANRVLQGLMHGQLNRLRETGFAMTEVTHAFDKGPRQRQYFQIARQNERKRPWQRSHSNDL